MPFLRVVGSRFCRLASGRDTTSYLPVCPLLEWFDERIVARLTLARGALLLCEYASQTMKTLLGRCRKSQGYMSLAARQEVRQVTRAVLFTEQWSRCT